MLRKLWALVAVIGLLASPAAIAVIGTIDVAPAATLLIPYFEVDTANPNGVTTLIGIQNSSASAAVAYFTVWTDLGVPTQTFNVYLTGYDTQTVNLRDLFVQGFVPRTADAGNDPGDSISPKGVLSQDINFPGGGLDADDFGFGDDGPAPDYEPPGDTPFLVSEYRTDLANAHTGRASTGIYLPAGRCAGLAYGDSIARGYVTIDSVNQQNALKPTNADAYFPGVLDFRNILFGDFMIVNPSMNFAEGDVAVHVEAVPFGQPLTDGVYTFYGGIDAARARNRREALPTRFVTPWIADSELITWRDGARPPSATGYQCSSSLYGAFPMGVAGVRAFDSEENPLGFTPNVAFQFAAQTNRLDETLLPGYNAVKQGWVVVDLSATAAGGSVYTSNPLARQGWLLHRRGLEPPGGQGRFRSMSSAIQLDNASQLTTPPPPRPAATPVGGAR